MSQGEQGWPSGESTCLSLVWGLGSSRGVYMWVEFVVGALLFSEGFSPGPPVSLLLKNQHFQIPI